MPVFETRPSIAIIPARGGSKGIPRKNLVELCGLPLIAWSILAARDSGAIDRVFVSTEDSEIAEVARAYGAEVPYLRPDELAGDKANVGDAIEHLLAQLEADGLDWGVRTNLFPTHPFRRPEMIAEMVQRCRTSVYAACTVVPLDWNPNLWVGKREDRWVPLQGTAGAAVRKISVVVSVARLPLDWRKVPRSEYLAANLERAQLGDMRFINTQYAVPVTDPILLTDLDSPEHLEEARQALQKGAVSWIPAFDLSTS